MRKIRWTFTGVSAKKRGRSINALQSVQKVHRTSQILFVSCCSDVLNESLGVTTHIILKEGN